MRPAGLQILRSDVDDVAADRLRRVESQRQVLVYLIDVQFAPVHRSHVDRTRLRPIHQLTVRNNNIIIFFTVTRKATSSLNWPP